MPASSESRIPVASNTARIAASRRSAKLRPWHARRTVIGGLPVPVLTRQVTPRAPRAGAEHDPVDHHPVIGPPSSPPGIGGHHRQQPLPLLISQVMPVPPALIYTGPDRGSTGHPRRVLGVPGFT